MKIEQQVCSLELTSKLKDLGVKQESIFIWMETKDKAWFLEYRKNAKYAMEQKAAFTASELAEMLPIELVYKGKILQITITRNKLKTYLVFYENIIFQEKICYPSPKHQTLADAFANVLIYLIENKLIEIKQ